MLLFLTASLDPRGAAPKTNAPRCSQRALRALGDRAQYLDGLSTSTVKHATGRFGMFVFLLPLLRRARGLAGL